jgi:hypothetical protein
MSHERKDSSHSHPQVRKHAGSCHCGAVRFEVEVDARKASRCNCSVCTKTGVLGAIVKPGAFVLLAGADSVNVYEWGARISKRFFCRRCGVQCFGRGHLAEVGGDYVSVNFNCLDDVELADVEVSYWDGRHDNWQAGTRRTPWPTLARVTPEEARTPSPGAA